MTRPRFPRQWTTLHKPSLWSTHDLKTGDACTVCGLELRPGVERTRTRAWTDYYGLYCTRKCAAAAAAKRAAAGA